MSIWVNDVFCFHVVESNSKGLKCDWSDHVALFIWFILHLCKNLKAIVQHFLFIGKQCLIATYKVLDIWVTDVYLCPCGLIKFKVVKM